MTSEEDAATPNRGKAPTAGYNNRADPLWAWQRMVRPPKKRIHPMERPDLIIQMKKEKEGDGMVLTLKRADGSQTWAHFKAAFPSHDLSHYAVETSLEAGHGFYGLVAQGWDFPDFGDPARRHAMPPDTLYLERITGLFWTEFHNNDVFPPETFEVEEAPEVPHLHGKLTEEMATSIRRLIRELVGQWKALPEREVLELPFSLPPS